MAPPQPKQPPVDYRETEWTDLPFESFTYVNVEKPARYKLRNEDGLELFYNYCFPEIRFTHETTKMFLLDQDDVKALRDLPGRKFANLEQFVAVRPSKKIYLRTFADTPVDRDAKRRVFAAEVIEVLHAMYKRQRVAMEKKKLDKLKKKWNSKNKRHYTTIGLDELREVMVDLNMNKELITLVPDILYHHAAVQNMAENMGANRIIVINPDKTASVSVGQIIFSFFKHIGGMIDFPHLRLGDEQECRKAVGDRRIILKRMREFSCLKPGTYVEDGIVRTLLEDFHMGIHPSQPFPPPAVFYQSSFNDRISLKSFVRWCQEYKLPDFQPIVSDSMPFLEKAVIPVWKANALFLILWIDVFFENLPRYEDLKKYIMDAIYNLVPLKKWESEDDFLSVILQLEEEKLGQVPIVARSAQTLHCSWEGLVWANSIDWEGVPDVERSRVWHHFGLALKKGLARAESIKIMERSKPEILEYYEKVKEEHEEQERYSMKYLWALWELINTRTKTVEEFFATVPENPQNEKERKLDEWKTYFEEHPQELDEICFQLKVRDGEDEDDVEDEDNQVL